MHPQVHLVGSMNLGSADEALRTAAEAVGDLVASIPDGETDERLNWVSAQAPIFARAAQLQGVGDEVLVVGEAGESLSYSQFVIRDDVEPEALDFGPLGYLAHAKESYALFDRLRREGVAPGGVRFQVSVPTPVAIIFCYAGEGDRLRIEPAYERQMIDEIRAISAAIPPSDLAIQWDVAVEMAMLEGVFPAYMEGDLLSEILERLARLGAAVHEDVTLGYHLCYGNAENVHWKEPVDTGNLVRVANGIAQAVPRRVDWIHMPVPIERDDDAYFAPLSDLRLAPETRLFLGLVHKEDGLEGARRRMVAAGRVVSDFGIATECGMGREPRQAVPDLLRLHADVAREL